MSESQPHRRRRWLVWEPRRLSWWMAVLFAIGSTCFLLGPIPAFVDLVGVRVDGIVFFVGSVFFTSAATLQWLQTIGPGRLATWEPHRVDWWSSGVQLLGTVFFNLTTFRALSTSTDSSTYDQVVWRPDALGSICFLVSGYLAYAELNGGLFHRLVHTRDGVISAVNFAGCVFFAISAVASYVPGGTDTAVNLSLTNLTTSLGALCFLIGALMLLPRRGGGAGSFGWLRSEASAVTHRRRRTA